MAPDPLKGIKNFSCRSMGRTNLPFFIAAGLTACLLPMESFQLTLKSHSFHLVKSKSLNGQFSIIRNFTVTNPTKRV